MGEGDYDDAVSGTSTKDTSSHAALDEPHSRHPKRDNYDANRGDIHFSGKKVSTAQPKKKRRFAEPSSSSPSF